MPAVNLTFQTTSFNQEPDPLIQGRCQAARRCRPGRHHLLEGIDIGQRGDQDLGLSGDVVAAGSSPTVAGPE